VDEPRPKTQRELAFPPLTTGEARPDKEEGTEPSTAKGEAESPANTALLMEEVCERKNLRDALHRVRSNKGSPGVDGMTVQALAEHLKKHWPTLQTQLLEGTYQPKPVKRVEIPKPDGGTRKLGVPTAQDRFVQQALMQVLQKRWDPTFSEQSFGFRPNRSAHQAVARAQEYITEGCDWVVDLDLEKFLDHSSYCSPFHERLSKRRAWESMTLIRNPLRFPRRRWIA
jgi:RNA-directed DNA polymerase